MSNNINYMVNRRNQNKQSILNWENKNDDNIINEYFYKLKDCLKSKNTDEAFNILQILFDENINQYFRPLMNNFIEIHSDEIEWFVDKWKYEYIHAKGLISFPVLIGTDLIKR